MHRRSVQTESQLCQRALNSSPPPHSDPAAPLPCRQMETLPYPQGLPPLQIPSEQQALRRPLQFQTLLPLQHPPHPQGLPPLQIPSAQQDQRPSLQFQTLLPLQYLPHPQGLPPLQIPSEQQDQRPPLQFQTLRPLQSLPHPQGLPPLQIPSGQQALRLSSGPSLHSLFHCLKGHQANPPIPRRIGLTPRARTL